MALDDFNNTDSDVTIHNFTGESSLCLPSSCSLLDYNINFLSSSTSLVRLLSPKSHEPSAADACIASSPKSSSFGEMQHRSFAPKK
eukprot:716320-Ditylum_brightwellii.AAC.1